MTATAPAFQYPPSSEGYPKQHVKIMRPYRIIEPRDPIRWGQEQIPHDPNTEYTEKYLGVGSYQKLQPILPEHKLRPEIGEFTQKPSVYRQDFIKLDTAKPPVHRPIESLEFGPEPPGTQRVSTYKDQYPQFLAYQKRQAIPTKGSHWINKPTNLLSERTTSYARDFNPHFGDSRRTLMRNDFPYQDPDVKFAQETTTKTDFQWNSDSYEAPLKSARPQYVATIPAPFDSQSHNRLTYVPHELRHYEAAFDDLCNPQVVKFDDAITSRSRVGTRHEGAGIEHISKKGKGPASPRVPSEVEALITSRTVGNLESADAISSRLEVLKQKTSGSPNPPNFSTTYRRAYIPSKK